MTLLFDIIYFFGFGNGIFLLLFQSINGKFYFFGFLKVTNEKSTNYDAFGFAFENVFIYLLLFFQFCLILSIIRPHSYKIINIKHNST